jgi:hypothetical protein
MDVSGLRFRGRKSFIIARICMSFSFS